MTQQLTSACRLATLVVVSWLLGVAAAAAQTVEYYHLDAVGSVRVVTDAAGNPTERHDFLPFGEEPNAAGVSDRRFTGKEHDAETGFDYFGARYYAAPTGRFTTLDPVVTVTDNLADPQRWNRYSYVRNNPLRYTDPDGKALDVAIDIAFIAKDVYDIASSAWRGERVTGVQAAALAGDVVGALVPFVTGVGQGIKAAAKAGDAIHAVTATRDAARAADAGRTSLIAANRAAGKAAEQKVAAEIAAEGGTIIGSQVCCRTPQGRRVIDLLTRDAAGNLTAVEVKSGNATRSAAQLAKDAEISAGRGTLVGRNAPAELAGQQRAIPTVERKPSP